MGFFAPLLAAAAAGGGAAAAGGSLITALGVASTALTGLSSWQQAKYQGYVAKNNALIADQNAQREADAAQQEQYRSDIEFRGLLGEQLAAQSASGLNVLGRSQLLTRENAARVGRETALDIRKKGMTAVERLKQDAANFRSEAKAAKGEAFSALAGTVLNIGKTLGKDPKFKSLLGGSRSTARG